MKLAGNPRHCAQTLASGSSGRKTIFAGPIDIWDAFAPIDRENIDSSLSPHRPRRKDNIAFPGMHGNVASRFGHDDAEFRGTNLVEPESARHIDSAATGLADLA